MSRDKDVGAAVGTLVCAFAIGAVMQSTEIAEYRYGDDGLRSAATDNADPPEDADMLMVGLTLTSAQGSDDPAPSTGR